CGSFPAITSLGHMSISQPGSGGTPSFSTTQPASGVQMAKLGAVTFPPSMRVGYPETPTSPPQVRLPTIGPTWNLRNIQGNMSPPDPAPSSMIITFGPNTAAEGE